MKNRKVTKYTQIVCKQDLINVHIENHSNFVKSKKYENHELNTQNLLLRIFSSLFGSDNNLVSDRFDPEISADIILVLKYS